MENNVGNPEVRCAKNDRKLSTQTYIIKFSACFPNGSHFPRCRRLFASLCPGRLFCVAKEFLDRASRGFRNQLMQFFVVCGQKQFSRCFPLQRKAVECVIDSSVM